MGGLWTPEMSKLAEALLPLISRADPRWERRHELMWYVSLCEQRGFCANFAGRQLCAQRWLAGKRKVSAPFTKTRKRAAAAKRKALSVVPEALKLIIDHALTTPQGIQFRNGNDKALNALVGSVLRQYKYDASSVKTLIEQQK